MQYCEVLRKRGSNKQPMKSAKGLAFSVAGVAVAVFGLSIPLAALVPNYTGFQQNPAGTFGVLIAAIGMILSVVAAESIQERP